MVAVDPGVDHRDCACRASVGRCGQASKRAHAPGRTTAARTAGRSARRRDAGDAPSGARRRQRRAVRRRRGRSVPTARPQTGRSPTRSRPSAPRAARREGLGVGSGSDADGEARRPRLRPGGRAAAPASASASRRFIRSPASRSSRRRAHVRASGSEPGSSPEWNVDARRGNPPGVDRGPSDGPARRAAVQTLDLDRRSCKDRPNASRAAPSDRRTGSSGMRGATLTRGHEPCGASPVSSRYSPVAVGLTVAENVPFACGLTVATVATRRAARCSSTGLADAARLAGQPAGRAVDERLRRRRQLQHADAEPRRAQPELAPDVGAAKPGLAE